jgi:hypothetical protein
LEGINVHDFSQLLGSNIFQAFLWREMGMVQNAIANKDAIKDHRGFPQAIADALN